MPTSIPPLPSPPLLARPFAMAVLCALLAVGQTNAVESSHVKALFRQPPREYSTGPLWVWNDKLTEEEIRGSLREIAAQDIKQVWIHPRPGLMTPYLSADWFRLWKVALKEARRLDMNVWIYDENSYPSGFAGGWVPELMPEARGRGLAFREARSVPKWSDDLLGVYRLETNNTFETVTDRAKAGVALPPARYMMVSEIRAGNSPWYGNRGYVSLLSPGVTRKFLDVTLEAYRRAVGGEFGKRVPGVFSDEPNIRAAGDHPWSAILADEFRKRWGYDLLECLPSLRQPVGDWRKVRHNYYQLLSEQFIAHWSQPYHDYCQSNHLEWTGHYWDHDWPNAAHVPDNMAMYAWHQRPGIDCLMNQYAEHTHAQFGNARMVRELSSVANQLGMGRTLCEVYGAAGWDLRFEDMKRIGDWLEVLGVNTLNQHLSYLTIRGARKRDHPQSFSYHEPWWKAYHVCADYFARLSAALSQGEQVNSILVLEPTTTGWMYQGDPARLDEVGERFFKLVMALEAAQVEYDLGSEDVLARHGSVVGSALQVGRRSYGKVILPPATENLNAKTAQLLNQLEQAGGTVISCGQPPQRTDGSKSPAGAALATSAHWKTVEAEELAGELVSPGLAISRSKEEYGLLFHHRRCIDDGEILFLVNTSLTSPSAGTLQSDMQGVEQWDLSAGTNQAYAFERAGRGIQAGFRLPPCGSLLLFLSSKPLPAAAPVSARVNFIQPAAPPQLRRLEPNVLTIDYVDVTAGGQTRTNLYFYAANRFAWRQNGLEGSPWDSAVQFKDELLSRKFPKDSGFEAGYRFTVVGSVPADLAIVIERSDLYTVACNGRPLKAKPNQWWLDKAFDRIELASAAHTGENVVTIKASPMTMWHDLEPAYVLGDFSLATAGRGFVILPAQALEPGKAWNRQGHPFYSAGVAYREQFILRRPPGQCAVVLSNWCGSVAGVTVNGSAAGYIFAPPWECEVSPWLKAGSNEVVVTVIGTLKNTLGPHHGNPPLGAAWPRSFQAGADSGPPPGDTYSTVAYGLFEPFVLKQSETPARP
jgi:hypothetical protein